MKCFERLNRKKKLPDWASMYLSKPCMSFYCILTVRQICPILPFIHKINTADVVMTDEIMTIKDIAAYLKVAEKTIYRLVTGNKLPSFKVGGVWRFRKAEIDQWISVQQDCRKDP